MNTSINSHRFVLMRNPESLWNRALAIWHLCYRGLHSHPSFKHICDVAMRKYYRSLEGQSGAA